MNLLLLSSISSTIRASNAQKQKQKPTAENYKKKSRIFWFDQNMKNDVSSQEMLCNKISENPLFFFLIFSGIPCWLRSKEKISVLVFEHRSLE